MVPVGVPHAWRADGGRANWIDMAAPQPRRPGEGPADTFFLGPAPSAAPSPLDVRDPRNRNLFRLDDWQMDVDELKQGAPVDQPTVSASMATALLAYSGIAVKMLVDQRLDAHLHTMFMVEYQRDRRRSRTTTRSRSRTTCSRARSTSSRTTSGYTLRPGDVFWTGVGCVHAFYNTRGNRVRWLETSAPGPPDRHSYRFNRDWDYLESQLESTGPRDDGDVTGPLPVRWLRRSRPHGHGDGPQTSPRPVLRSRVWNRTDERCDALSSIGATVRRNAEGELAEQCDVVVTMVADADALRAILEGDDGLLAGLRPDVDRRRHEHDRPDAALELARAVAERGAHWIDAPVSGSTALAEKGELTLMIGGEADAIARAGPVLERMSAKKFHLGGAGAGAAMKLAVNSVDRRPQRGDRRGARARRAGGDRSRGRLRRLRGRSRRRAVCPLQARRVPAARGDACGLHRAPDARRISSSR